MGWHEVTFPASISVGSIGGPEHRIQVTELLSGIAERVDRWGRPRWSFDVRQGVRTRAQAYELTRFILARNGAMNAFRFKDPLDNTSANNGTSAPTGNDQQLGVGDGATLRFPLVKLYSDGGHDFTRVIQRPILSSIVVHIDGSPVPDADWTFDYDAVEVVFVVAPAIGEVVTAGYRFDVPVRLSLPDRQWLSWGWSTSQILELESIPLVEEPDPVPYAATFDPGGGIDLAMTSSAVFLTATTRVWRIDPAAASRRAVLPHPSLLPDGGPWFIVHNSSGTHTLDLRDHAATLLSAIPIFQSALVFLTKDPATGSKTWRALVG